MDGDPHRGSEITVPDWQVNGRFGEAETEKKDGELPQNPPFRMTFSGERERPISAVACNQSPEHIPQL